MTSLKLDVQCVFGDKVWTGVLDLDISKCPKSQIEKMIEFALSLGIQPRATGSNVSPPMPEQQAIRIPNMNGLPEVPICPFHGTQMNQSTFKDKKGQDSFFCPEGSNCVHRCSVTPDGQFNYWKVSEKLSR